MKDGYLDSLTMEELQQEERKWYGIKSDAWNEWEESEAWEEICEIKNEISRRLENQKMTYTVEINTKDLLVMRCDNCHSWVGFPAPLDLDALNRWASEHDKKLHTEEGE